MDRLVVVGRKARRKLDEGEDAAESEILRPTAVVSEESRRGDRDPKDQETSKGNAATRTPIANAAPTQTPTPNPETQTRRNPNGQRARILRLWKRMRSS